VIFEGIGAKGMLDMFYDFNTNTKVWEKTNLLGGKPGTFGAPVLVDDNTLLWTSGAGYSLVSAKTGDISYSAPSLRRILTASSKGGKPLPAPN